MLFTWFSCSLMMAQVAVALGWITFEAEAVILPDGLLGYTLSNLPFGFWCLGMMLSMSLIHRRSLLTLVRADQRIRWRRIAQGFGVWMALVTIPVVMALVRQFTLVEFDVDWGIWLRLVGLAVILTPLQTTTEELFFRGYVMQGLGLLSRNGLVLCVGSAILFTLPHLSNPEMVYGWWPLALYYFSFGILHAWLTLKDDGLELALGLHAANNLFAALFVTYENAVIETPALLSSSHVDGVALLLGFGIRAVAFSLLFFGLAQSSRSSGPKKERGRAT